MKRIYKAIRLTRRKGGGLDRTFSVCDTGPVRRGYMLRLHVPSAASFPSEEIFDVPLSEPFTMTISHSGNGSTRCPSLRRFSLSPPTLRRSNGCENRGKSNPAEARPERHCTESLSSVFTRSASDLSEGGCYAGHRSGWCIGCTLVRNVSPR